MESKLRQKAVKILVVAVLILANLWVWADSVRGCNGFYPLHFP